MKIKRKTKKKKPSARVLALAIQAAQEAEKLANALGADPALPEDARAPYAALLKTLDELHRITNSGAPPRHRRPQM